MPQPAGCTVQKHAQLSISHRFFRCVPVCVCVCVCVCVAFRIGFCIFLLSLDFLHMPASSCSCLSTLCGGLGGGDDVHDCDLCFLFLLVTPTNMQLVSCTADADSDVADVAIVWVVISGYLLLDFAHAYHAKTWSFCKPSRQKLSQLTLKLNKKHEKHGICDTFAKKRYQKTRTKDIGKRKHRNVLLLTKKGHW